MDAQHPALVHLAPALVGPPDPGLVRPGRQAVFVGESEAEEADAPRHYGRTCCAATRTCSTPGSRRRCGRSRPWAGRRDTRSWSATTRPRAGHRLRHHLLLGRPDDDDGPALHGRGAVPHRLHPRPRARRARPEDVEDQGQRHRPLGADRRLRRRCAALRCSPRPRRAATSSSAERGSRATATSSPSSGTPRASAR